MNDKLRDVAEHDGLTKLFNRRKTEQLIGDRYNELVPGKSAGLIMADIDFFKKINDTYGHAVGDKTLITTAKVMMDIFEK